jgi:hypothetical protein
MRVLLVSMYLLFAGAATAADNESGAYVAGGGTLGPGTAFRQGQNLPALICRA